MVERPARIPRWSDAPLVARVKKGDAGAWHQLVDRYGDYVNALLRSASVPEADRPDAFQHVFVELFRALGKLEQTDHLAPWLRQTTLRHGIKLRRKAARETELPEEELVAPDSLSQELELAERRLLIRVAVLSLKDQCRQLITLLFFADPPQPYAEVAQSLGLSVGSMGQTRQRCLDALRKALIARGIA